MIHVLCAHALQYDPHGCRRMYTADYTDIIRVTSESYDRGRASLSLQNLTNSPEKVQKAECPTCGPVLNHSVDQDSCSCCQKILNIALYPTCPISFSVECDYFP